MLGITNAATDSVDRFTIIDEADELLSDGWEEAMDKLFQGSGLFWYLPCLIQTDVACRRQLGC
jgi:hypothetical protein